MGMLKRGLKGMVVTLFLFILIVFTQVAGLSIFDPAIATVAGAILIIGMGFFETNLITYG